MKADIYIANKSFFYRDDLTDQKLMSELKILINTIKGIKNHADRFPEHADLVRLCNEVYSHIILNGHTLAELLYGAHSKIISRDVKVALRSMFDKLKKTEDTSDDVLSYLDDNDANPLSGLLCSSETLTNDPDILKYESLLINTIQDWYKFHRHFLESNYTDATYFYNELPIYYDNIFFHPNVEKTLKGIDGGLKNYVKQISLNLMYLNDHFTPFAEKYTPQEAISMFSKSYPIKVTLEGDITKKKHFSFDFYNSNSKKEEPIYCEPHLKLKTNDNPGNTHRDNNRIYFHCGIPGIEDGKILVGYIGHHPDV